MNLKDLRVSLANRPGRRGTRRSGSLDPDLMAWVLRALDLIGSADSGSDGQDGSGTRVGGAQTPVTFPAVAPNAGSPEFAKLVLQGLKQPALGPRGYYSACVVHWGT